MTRRSVLNVTSRKKRNTMLSWANTNSSGASVTVARGPAYIAGNVATANVRNVAGFFVWNCTAQSLFANGNSGNVIINQAERTSTVCYMKGLSEHLRISTSTGLPWFHRRICFISNDSFIPNTTDTAPQASVQNYADTSSGIERLWFNLSVNSSPNALAAIYEEIFKGRADVDWTDPIVAPLDNGRIKVMYDRTFTYRSGNTVGTVKEAKVYHPMNKNLIYDDEENGAGELGSYYCSQSRVGMGNYFVCDIFSPLQGGTASDVLRIDASSTLYWHEK